jgi:Tfp pilus assembly protein PilN
MASRIYRIDLNKSRVLQKEKVAAIRRTRFLIGLYGVVAVALAVVAGLSSATMNTHISRRQAAIETVHAQLNELTRSETYVSREDVMSLVRLERERLLWTGYLVRICDDVPGGVALTRIAFKGNRLEVEGIARIPSGGSEFDLVRSFIGELNADSALMAGFRPLEFETATRLVIKEKDILSFQLTSGPHAVAEPAEVG